MQPTAIVLKMAANTKRQHAAIGKLVKMAQSSAVVTKVSRGITAEVRRDRERIQLKSIRPFDGH